MPEGFIHNISPHSLNRLRRVVRKVHMQYWPERLQTDMECDKIIEALGQEVVEAQLKRLVDTGQEEKQIYVGGTLNPITKGMRKVVG